MMIKNLNPTITRYSRRLNLVRNKSNLFGFLFLFLLLGTGTQLAAQDSLSITKTSSTMDPVHLGDAIQYNLTVSNTSAIDTNNQVMISDVAPMNTTLVPGSLSYVSGIPPDVSSPLSPNWTITQLLPGEATTVTFSVTVM